VVIAALPVQVVTQAKKLRDLRASLPKPAGLESASLTQVEFELRSHIALQLFERLSERLWDELLEPILAHIREDLE
jgi:hypothetical protein